MRNAFPDVSNTWTMADVRGNGAASASAARKSCPPALASVVSRAAGEPQPRLTARVTVRATDFIASAFAIVEAAAASTCR